MPEEEKKEEATVPPIPPSEEKKTEGEEIPPEPPKAPDTTDYKAELEKKEQEFEQERQEKAKEINRLGFRNRKIEKALADSGIEIPEGEGLSEDVIRDIVVQSVKEAVKPIIDDLEKTRGQLSEATRALAGKASEGKGGGAGQKPAQKKTMPPLSEEDRNLIRQYNLKWDSEKGVFITPSGRVCDLSSKSGLAAE